MSSELGDLLIANIPTWGIVAAAYIQSRRASASAEKAVAQTVSTGNGFATDVVSRLEHIVREVESANRKIDQHVADHASAQIHGSKT